MNWKLSKKEKPVACILITIILAAVAIVVLEANGYYISYSTGPSMKPTWKYLNIVWGHRPHSALEIQNGSVVSFHFEGMSLTHRITDILNTTDGTTLYVATADNPEISLNGTVGQTFTYEQVIMIVDGHFGLC